MGKGLDTCWRVFTGLFEVSRYVYVYLLHKQGENIVNMRTMDFQDNSLFLLFVSIKVALKSSQIKRKKKK